MPVALVVAAKLYLRDLWQALDQSGIHVVAAEFERSVSLAIEHQPDIILVASPPIGDAVNACQRLLENPSTINIPIFLSSLGDKIINDACSIFFNTPTQARLDDFPSRQTARGKKGGTAGDAESAVDVKRRRQLLSMLDLLRYAETEISKLGLETSSVLLGATIADVAENLE
ncbi:hypothetical protein [Bradyrhizobium sp. CCBAU 51753]|uniref:hypothetical protein n=1 Tax=Bradyrhizobium sp. CCBAU 51753 TaxID=1325100 RepID=UPI00188B1E4A|nr:hypothetical protein [Bradyrhizobium sp. CCBAU 51753]QOZ23931.1 hypothetical protein XH93_10170 [Bradyrhizobium sp. CCBAU 51753]